MESQALFLDCPEYIGGDAGARCGLPAEVESSYTIRSTNGPLHSARIRCSQGHWFNGPLESLAVRAADTAGRPAGVRLRRLASAAVTEGR
jgi:hypothetical protein